MEKEFIFGNVDASDDENCTSWALVQDEMRPIKELMLCDEITDIFVDRYDRVNVMRRGKLETTDVSFHSESRLVSLIAQCATALKQKFDDEHPILDARLPNGSRLNCTDSIITPQGATLSLRKVPKNTLTESDFLASGMFTTEILDYLKDVIRNKDIFLISGNMGSGKTSLLRLLSDYVDRSERLITAEDTQELHINDKFPFGIPMEAAKRDGFDIGLPELIHATLRQQPDRVWVGELRTSEAVDAFMQVIYTGVRGCAATIHGASAANAVRRIQYLLASAGNVDFDLTGQLIKDQVNVIIQTHRDPKWGRKITEIGRLVDGEVKLIFKFNTKTGEQERLI